MIWLDWRKGDRYSTFHFGNKILSHGLYFNFSFISFINFGKAIHLLFSLIFHSLLLFSSYFFPSSPFQVWNKGNTLFIFLLFVLFFLLYYLYHQLYFIFIYFSDKNGNMCRPVEEKLWHSQYIISHSLFFCIIYYYYFILYTQTHKKCGTKVRLAAEKKQSVKRKDYEDEFNFSWQKIVLFVKLVIIYLSFLVFLFSQDKTRQEWYHKLF